MVRPSPRQQQILQLIAQGKSNKEIAALLGLSTGTVKQHVYALFRKLGVRKRTAAIARGAEFLAASVASTLRRLPAAGDPAPGSVPDELRYARRLVTAVVIEPRPEPTRGQQEAAESARRVQALRARVEALADAYDACAETLVGGGVAVWFGQPIAHGDDAERAVAFVRVLELRAHLGVPYAAGIGTVAEVVGEGGGGAIAYRTFRVAALLAGLANPRAPLACGVTLELAGCAGAGGGAENASPLPERAQPLGLAPQPAPAAAAPWGGLPFVRDLAAGVKRSRGQWLAVDSWPPESGTRLINAIGETLAARRMPVHALWLPAAASGGDGPARLIEQLAQAATDADEAERPLSLVDAIARLAQAGPCALLAYGIDALDALKAAFGASGLDRMRSIPLIVVAGAMHRTGAPQTTVRLLGSHPGASPFVRVLQMTAPERAPAALDGLRPDVQAVLDAVSVEARAIARIATDPQAAEIDAIARALAMSRDMVVARCRELESSGLVSMREGRLQFRDALTAEAVRASLA